MNTAHQPTVGATLVVDRRSLDPPISPTPPCPREWRPLHNRHSGESRNPESLELAMELVSTDRYMRAFRWLFKGLRTRGPIPSPLPTTFPRLEAVREPPSNTIDNIPLPTILLPCYHPSTKRHPTPSKATLRFPHRKKRTPYETNKDSTAKLAKERCPWSAYRSPSSRR